MRKYLVGLLFLSLIPIFILIKISKTPEGLKPNFANSPYLISEKFSYLFKKPKAGDIVLATDRGKGMIGMISFVKQRSGQDLYEVTLLENLQSGRTLGGIKSEESITQKFIFPNYKPTDNASSYLPQKPVKRYEVLESIYQGFLEDGNLTYKFNDQLKGRVWWILDSSYNILDTNASSISMSVPTGDLVTLPWEYEYTDQVYQKLDSIFSENGFIKNENNSSDKVDLKVTEFYSKYYDYIVAYEKGDIKCTVTTNRHIMTDTFDSEVVYYVDVSCSDSIDQLAQEQLPFLEALKEKSGTIKVTKQNDSFVKLNVYYRRIGHYSILKRINEEWSEIYAGQENPKCDLMQKYQVPEEIYEECTP